MAKKVTFTPQEWSCAKELIRQKPSLSDAEAKAIVKFLTTRGSLHLINEEYNYAA